MDISAERFLRWILFVYFIMANHLSLTIVGLLEIPANSEVHRMIDFSVADVVSINSSPTPYRSEQIVNYLRFRTLNPFSDPVVSSFFLTLTFWGICSTCFTFSKGYSALLALRFGPFLSKYHTWYWITFVRVLLGIGEAGYYAGLIYYLSFWYKRWSDVSLSLTNIDFESIQRHEIALRISLCMTGTLPGAIGGLLAFGLVRAHTKDLVG